MIEGVADRTTRLSNTAIDAPTFTPNGVFTTASCDVDEAPSGSPVALNMSNLTVDASASGAAISWNTSVPASTLVMYGATSGYGQQLVVDGEAAAHNASLSGLSCGTEYHFRAVSSTPSGSVVSSADATFSTDPCPVI